MNTYNRMKYLQKFNESKFILSEHIDITYVEECFVNFMEEYDTHIDYETQDGEKITWELIVYPNDFKKITEEYDPNEIPSIREHLDNTSAILEQIDGCIEKLRIKYPGLTPAISIEYEYRDDKTNWGFYNPIVAITVMITKKCLESNNIIS